MSHTDTDDIHAFGCGVIVAAVSIFISTVILISTSYVHKSEAIEHGAAYYHPETGEFTWKDEVKE